MHIITLRYKLSYEDCIKFLADLGVDKQISSKYFEVKTNSLYLFDEDCSEETLNGYIRSYYRRLKELNETLYCSEPIYQYYGGFSPYDFTYYIDFRVDLMYLLTGRKTVNLYYPDSINAYGLEKRYASYMQNFTSVEPMMNINNAEIHHIEWSYNLLVPPEEKATYIKMLHKAAIPVRGYARKEGKTSTLLIKSNVYAKNHHKGDCFIVYDKAKAIEERQEYLLHELESSLNILRVEWRLFGDRLRKFFPDNALTFDYLNTSDFNNAMQKRFNKFLDKTFPSGNFYKHNLAETAIKNEICIKKGQPTKVDCRRIASLIDFLKIANVHKSLSDTKANYNTKQFNEQIKKFNAIKVAPISLPKEDYAALNLRNTKEKYLSNYIFKLAS